MSLTRRLERLERELDRQGECPHCANERGLRTVTMRYGDAEPPPVHCEGCGRELPTVAVLVFA